MKTDLYAWREIFQLYVEAEVFESVHEMDRGERSVEQSETRLRAFADRVTQRGLTKRLKLKQSKGALEMFLDLNMFILNVKKVREPVIPVTAVASDCVGVVPNCQRRSHTKNSQEAHQTHSTSSSRNVPRQRGGYQPRNRICSYTSDFHIFTPDPRSSYRRDALAYHSARGRLLLFNMHQYRVQAHTIVLWSFVLCSVSAGFLSEIRNVADLVSVA